MDLTNIPITYGPAVSRITRTPITYGPTDQDSGGVYAPPTPISQLLNFLPALAQKLGGESIQIDPSKINDVGAAIRHEEIHSILNNAPVKSLAVANPYYKQIANKLTGFGDLPTEIPAYMGAYEKSVSNMVPQDVRDSYVAYLGKQLIKLDPKLAATFQRLSAPTATTTQQ